jgi:hypothetical protein
MFSSVLCSLLFALRTSLCTVQVGDVPKLMAKYKGKETALYAAMLKKYEINDVEDFFEGMSPPDEETPDEDEEEEEDEAEEEEEADDDDDGEEERTAVVEQAQQEEAEPSPAPASVAAPPKQRQRKELSVSDIKERVTYVYEQKNPEKLKDMRKLMIKFRGREKLFYRAIKAKYEVDEQFFAEEFGDDDPEEDEEEQESDATASAAAAATADAAGGGDDADSSEAALAEAEAARAERAAALEAAVAAGESVQWTAATVQMRVMAMYADKNPEKEADVPSLMEKYTGKEMALYTAICKKYGYSDKDFMGDGGEPVMKKPVVVQQEDPAERARREKEAKEAKEAEDALQKSLEDGRKMDEDEKLSKQIEELQNKARALKERGKERCVP